MHLHSQWKLILRKAWSVRFALLSAACSAIEVVLQKFAESDGTFATAAAVAAAVATVARIIAQPETFK